jgi:hypothetical protein
MLELPELISHQGGPTMQYVKDISSRVEQELEQISDCKLVSRIRELLVTPYPVERAWDYGSRGEHFVCWTVLQHQPSNTGMAFCLQGFGPADPWGLVSLSGSHMNIGMDSSWFASVEDAMRGSRAWDGQNPEGYEVR